MTFHVAISKVLKIYCLSYYHGNAVEILVLNPTASFIVGRFLLASLLFTPIVFSTGRSFFYSRHIKIADVNDYSINEGRDIYSTFDTEDQSDQGLPIDPFDLMNRIKQAGAMNDATTPSDALDDALNAFNESEYENVPIE